MQLLSSENEKSKVQRTSKNELEVRSQKSEIRTKINLKRNHAQNNIDEGAKRYAGKL